MENVFLFLPDDEEVGVMGVGVGVGVVEEGLGFLVRRPFFPTSVHPLESAIGVEGRVGVGVGAGGGVGRKKAREELRDFSDFFECECECECSRDEGEGVGVGVGVGFG